MSWEALEDASKTLGDSKAFGGVGALGTGWSIFNHATADAPGWYKGASLATDALGVAQMFPKCPQTPIIQAGLLAISAMSLQCGLGTPDDGSRFGDGCGEFRKTDELQESAVPNEQWQGSASKAYDAQVVRQRERAQKLAQADEMMQEVIRSQAEQVSQTRQLLDIYSIALAAMIVPATIAMYTPYGQPASVAIQAGAVAGTVPLATGSMLAMAALANANAAKVLQATAHYTEVAGEA